MKTPQEMAREFRRVFKQETGILAMQLELIDEEFSEFSDALWNQEPTENQLKELADLVYVCYQFACAAGWDLDTALERVHQSNLTKLVDGKPTYREDGKVLKGPNYKKPDLRDLV
jgi:predicted HAD superfamily Cof-like phosphohydrolase